MTSRIARIDWGAGFTGSIEFGYPLDFAKGFEENREGSVTTQFVSGEEDAWIVGTDQVLDATVRWVPATSGSLSSTGLPLSSWDGVGAEADNGWRAFLTSARRAEQFRFFPDRDSGTFILSTLVDADEPSIEPADGTFTFTIRIRNPITPYSGYAAF